jgi:GNAT superfamily N-acetyltransferase
VALREGAFGLVAVADVDPKFLQAFSCGKAHLDTFLAASSVELHAARLGLTTVVFHDDVPGEVVGYFTLSNDGIPLTTNERFELGLADLTSYPAVKLGRLAVAAKLQGQGVGAQLMDLVFGEILDSSSLSATRLVIVDADNDPAVLKFYRGRGFVESIWAERQASNHGRGQRGNPPATVKMLKDILDSA